MAVLDALASEVHYVDHLAPIWLGLPDETRGRFLCSTHDARDRALDLLLPNVERKLVNDARQPHRQPVLVAAYNDLMRCKGRPAIFVEHGAGQSYAGDPSMVGSPWYPGGTGRDAVRLFVCPNESVAERNRARYPDAQTAVVGSPALDGLYRERQEATRDPDQITIAVSFHANLRTAGGGSCPEFGWAWPNYAAVIAELVHTTRYRWLGHAHPRAWRHLARWWADIGAVPTRDYRAVTSQADLFICDNSSALYECAALGIPSVVLNSPTYRRNIEHGLRFWSEADVGVQVDEPHQLPIAIDLALADPPDQAARRAHIARQVYAIPPPDSTHAAVEAIVRCLSP